MLQWSRRELTRTWGRTVGEDRGNGGHGKLTGESRLERDLGITTM